MHFIYMLIFTVTVNGYHEVSIAHTETPCPTLQACHKAYDIDNEQIAQTSVNATVSGTCLKVQTQ
jgi:hypothetical protein